MDGGERRQQLGDRRRELRWLHVGRHGFDLNGKTPDTHNRCR